MDVTFAIFAFFIFPGFLFTVIAGLVSTWIDRKVTARVQWRVGPPLLQPFYDVFKLVGKDTMLPSTGSRVLFIIAPLLGLISVSIVSAMLWLANTASISFIGDVIVVIYLLVVPSLMIILGGLSSGNPLATAGASREMKLLLSYELPLLICLAVAILKSGVSIMVVDIAQTPVALSVSGALALLVSLLCVHAKLGFTPFDVAEAETEIMEGPYIEYSGPLLALYKLTQAMLLITLPVYLATIFLGGLTFSGIGILWSIVKLVLILVVIIVIKNTNPRIRIDQALRFFWRTMMPIAVIAFILAAVGQFYRIPWL
jgi:NADH-quinone oxidoreductase subunit H